MARLRILTVLDRHGGAAENDSNAAGETLKAAKRLVPVKEYPLCRVLGHRRCIDNIFIERLLRSLSYDRVPPTSGKGRRQGLPRRTTFRNHQRTDTPCGGQPPAVIYFNTIAADQQIQELA